ncbi:MAG: hypothetical protein GEU99_06680 [Luteitalea sp.]|nr:hypothetical protein [Luteitalea sp.]
MKIITGTVVHGQVDLPADALGEGSHVAVLAPDPAEPIALTGEQERELLAAMDAIRRGEYISGTDLLAELRSREAR